MSDSDNDDGGRRDRTHAYGDESQFYQKKLSSMAEAGHPALELHTLRGGVSSAQEVTTVASRRAGGPVSTIHLLPEEATSDTCEERSAAPSTREAACSGSRASGGVSEQQLSPPEHCVVFRALPPPPQSETVSNHSSNSEAGWTVQSLNLASVTVHRSHPDGLAPVKEAVAPQDPDWETSKAETQSMLACKQPMQVQQCNTVTTICRGASSREGCTRPPQNRCAWNSPVRVQPSEDKCHEALCYGCSVHHSTCEDTFAAYCHPQSIPAPSQLLPRLTAIEPRFNIQRAATPPPAAAHLTPPRLFSSVSETGLDAKHGQVCCHLRCSWINALPACTAAQSPQQLIREECCPNTSTKHDIGTMTVPKALRDVGVQTSQSISPHVFPHICLTSRAEMSSSQTLSSHSNADEELGDAAKSPVKDVKWDAEGMTWEVYGASVDPEELGLAIQRHLELQIKETANRASLQTRQNTKTSLQSGKTSLQRKSSRMMRTVACCGRSSAAGD